MSLTIDNLLSEFAGELQMTHQRYSSFVKKAEDEGYPQLAKYFRAIVISETVREERFRCGMAHHAEKPMIIMSVPTVAWLLLVKHRIGARWMTPRALSLKGSCSLRGLYQSRLISL